MARKKRSSKKTALTEGSKKSQVKENSGSNIHPLKSPPAPTPPKSKEFGETEQPKKTDSPSQEPKVSFGWDEMAEEVEETKVREKMEEDFGLPKVEDIPPMPEIVSEDAYDKNNSISIENTVESIRDILEQTDRSRKVEPDERFPEPEKPKKKKETVADIHERSIKSDKRQRVWAKIKGFFSSDMDVEQYTILKLVANILTTFNFLVNFATLLAILYASYVLMTALCIDGEFVSTDSIVRLAGLFLFILTMIFIHERIDS